ncbi:MAG: hypothetical protein IJ562_10025 [Prevotella sp.]|nr:hypothetical protein [Prevotella sp.]
MTYLILSLIGLGILAAAIGLLSHNKDGGSSVIMKGESSCATCNGDNDKCEQECMMEAATKDIVYFDDEELDAFRSRTAGSYTDAEAEQFREIVYTMKQAEVKEWTRSLSLRGIELPNQVKDEVFLLIDESPSR